MRVDYHLKIQEVLMADSGEAGFSLQKAAQVRLDKLGLVKNHCVSLIIKSALNYWNSGWSSSVLSVGRRKSERVVLLRKIWLRWIN